MKPFIASLGLAILVLSTVNPTAHASSIPGITAAVGAVSLDNAFVDLGGGNYSFNYLDIEAGFVTSDIVGVFVDAGPVAVLSVTDICAAVELGLITIPCKAEAFSFTDINALGANLDLGVAIGLFVDESSRINILGNSISDNLAAGIGLSDDVIDFPGGPGGNPGGGTPSPTPEPSSLCLMATGLAAAAGAVRRRITLNQNPLKVCA